MTKEAVLFDRTELFADGNRGIYIPQYFAESVRRERVRNVEPEEWEILEAGPDHELYSDVWNDVEQNAVLDHPTLGECVLVQDQDLWIVPVDLLPYLSDDLEYDEFAEDDAQLLDELYDEGEC
jgi:hypothetical protein